MIFIIGFMIFNIIFWYLIIFLHATSQAGQRYIPTHKLKLQAVQIDIKSILFWENPNPEEAEQLSFVFYAKIQSLFVSCDIQVLFKS